MILPKPTGQKNVVTMRPSLSLQVTITKMFPIIVRYSLEVKLSAFITTILRKESSIQGMTSIINYQIKNVSNKIFFYININKFAFK